MPKHRVLYYALPEYLDFGHKVLSQKPYADAIDLVDCVHAPYCSPTAEELDGMEAVIGEFMPVDAECAARMEAAGVKLVASMSIGTNHMDLAALREHGVTVTNCPGYCAEDVATHALGLMLDLFRKITFQNRSMLGGGWDPVEGYPTTRVSGKTLGLVFFGRIAQALVPMARGLGMRVIAWAPTKSAETLAEFGVEKAETLDDLLVQSDVVSLHCPLIPETEGLIGKRELALMKPSAYLINTARGEVVDEDALVAALDESIASDGERGITAAGLDTLAGENDGTDNLNRRLIEHPRCVTTPHSAYLSRESTLALASMSLDSCAEILIEGRTPTNAVN
ncbi:2-hydroxyacid dehydrogenase [uncultured Parolsenella sp.]|uniref:2-hydroxyacid dehydrogenase n=1 Tax=uncultured Parolsenella sp. TaxID=2083008 RepID=UPI0025F4E47F|nr:C-terminal binding protein [uncultured Parolsenella sp.]